MSFLKSFQNKSAYSNYPFDHWELNEPLTNEQIKEIIISKYRIYVYLRFSCVS